MGSKKVRQSGDGFDRNVRIRPETHRALKKFASGSDRHYQDVADELIRKGLVSLGQPVIEGRATANA